MSFVIQLINLYFVIELIYLFLSFNPLIVQTELKKSQKYQKKNMNRLFGFAKSYVEDQEKKDNEVGDELAIGDQKYVHENLVSHEKMESTFAWIKPDAFSRKEEILDMIELQGIKVRRFFTVTLSEEEAKEFYEEHDGKPFFHELITHMTSGRCLAIELCAPDVVKKWRQMMGPTDPEEAKKVNPECIRALYGTNLPKNAAHGSDSAESAARELEFVFERGILKLICTIFKIFNGVGKKYGDDDDDTKCIICNKEKEPILPFFLFRCENAVYNVRENAHILISDIIDGQAPEDKSDLFPDVQLKSAAVPPLPDSVFPVHDIFPNEWHTLETPAVERILDTQGLTQDEKFWVYAFIGRMFYPRHFKDNWREDLCITGVPASGKTLLTKQILAMFGGLKSSYLVKVIHEHDERKIDFQKDDWLGCMAVISSQTHPFDHSRCDFMDNESVPVIYITSAIERSTLMNKNACSRLVNLHFAVEPNPYESDPRLEVKMQMEVPRTLKKCNLAYLYAVEKFGNRALLAVLPKSFQRPCPSEKQHKGGSN